MIKKIHFLYTLCLMLAASEKTTAQTVLNAGDIVILGLNADDAYPNEKWAFVTMKPLTAGTIIHFTDKGYDNTLGDFRAVASPENDGFMTWVVPAPIARGTIIYATNTTINGSTNGVTGQLGNGTTNGFSTSGDQIIVYRGTSGTAAGATFIYAINTGQVNNYTAPGTWLTSGVVNADYLSYLPPGLSNGTTALALTSNVFGMSSGPGTLGTPNYGFNNMKYGGAIVGTQPALLALIGDPANWVGTNGAGTGYDFFTGGGEFPATEFTVLPVTLLHFNTEETTGGAVKLSWSTAMEVNNDHFTVERSSDGLHYTVIALVPGKGDNNQPVDYSFTDEWPGHGSNYYRLTQTDRDGRSKILGTRRVEVAAIALRVGPNPAVNNIDVAFNRGVWRELKLYNSAEQLMQTISPRATTSRLKISLQNYRPGIYYLAFIGNNGQSTVRRFIKRE